jgi:hypothetical protein
MDIKDSKVIYHLEYHFSLYSYFASDKIPAQNCVLLIIDQKVQTIFHLLYINTRFRTKKYEILDAQIKINSQTKYYYHYPLTISYPLNLT